MKFLFPFALIVLMGLAPTSSPSVVELTWALPDKKFGNCTGFYVAPTLILTAEHCNPREEQMLTADGTVLRQVKVEEETFRLFQTPTIGVPFKLASPKMNEWVTAIGNAYGDGLVSLRREIVKLEMGDHLWLDGPVAQGMSGGPVVNSKGEVVGLIQATNTVFGFACGGAEIKEFLK